MQLFCHYCTHGFSNCYILGSEETPRQALLIDPGSLDTEIINIIEENEYTLAGVLVTHTHRHHIQGLNTLLRIYQADIYAIASEIGEHTARRVSDGETITIGPFTVEVISVPGHTADSAVFRVGRFLFTGDVLSAGLIGSAASPYGAAVEVRALRGRIFPLPGNYFIFPGHGPPSSLEAERRFNEGLRSWEAHNARRPRFKADLEFLN
ncbi:MAG: MBL fold metallo-hydrolase [Treponema sp.]|jgi:glyoxylase-like metal-dependent hydrolase (beta-lactamase superfamily II)|nr:MBL fold metallo-hydrolase [Treponema sp.]